MSYASERASISRAPVSFMVLTLDYCARTFGSAPCLATGTPCYNTFPTCKYKTAYSKTQKDYRITSADAPLPFRNGERPYIKAIRYLPCEIKDNLTINGRVTVDVLDEPDTDVGIDPYVTQRASVQGTFWKKLLARNPNYKGRPVKLYEGFYGNAEAEFVQTSIGTVENITRERDGGMKIEIVDLLKSIDSVDVPPKLDVKLVAGISAGAASATLNTLAGLDQPSGYVRMGDEIAAYSGVDTGTNQITGLTRGAFSTTAAAHNAKDAVQKVRYYAPANGFDILKEMLLTDAGIDAANVDAAAFDSWRDWPGGEINFSAIVSEPTKLSKLYFELVDLLDCKSWVAEDLKITIRRNIPNEPDRAYVALTDEANIIHGSGSTDFNNKSRLSRVFIYWDKSTLGKIDEPTSYRRLDIALDADAESANEYDEVVEKKIFCRWLRSGYEQEEIISQFVKNFTMRQVFRQRDAMPIISLDVELKDAGIKTGTMLQLTTDELVDIHGNPLTEAIFQVIRREPKGAKISLRVLGICSRKFAFIAPNDAPDYDASTAADREYMYICDADGLMPDGSQGYFIY